MINLEKYYKEHVSKEDYYYKFYNELITKAEEDKKVMEEINLITNDDPYDEMEYEAFDDEDVIRILKDLCEPSLDITTIKNTRLFYFVLFYLHDNGYKIKEFPRIIDRPPEDPYKFTCNDIRNLAIERGLDHNNTVQYITRRKIVENLTFEKEATIKIENNIDKMFMEISTRNARFENMTIDEKIKEIANLIETLLYVDGNYIKLDYSKHCFEYVDDEIIKKYRKQIQCFRHSSNNALEERKQFGDEEKEFIIDYGITIIKLIYSFK